MKKSIAIVLLLLLPMALASDARPEIRIDFVSQNPDPVQPGDTVELRWIVSNSANAGGTYKFEIVEAFPIIIDRPDLQILERRVSPNLGARDGVVLFYEARIDQQVTQPEQTIRLRYWNVNTPTQVTEIQQQIRIEQPRGRIQVSDVVLQPEKVQVGSQFKIDIGVENLASNSISSVQVRLNTQDTGFTPIGSSNQKTISRIPANSKGFVSFTYFVDTNTRITVQSIPVEITYMDSNNQERTFMTTIGIPISAEPTYLYNLEQTGIRMAGQRGTIVASISNIGNSNINFAVLELLESENYQILSTSKSYLGNLESDDFETGQFDIFVFETDKSSIPLLFQLTYRDEYDQVYTEQFELQQRLFSQTEARQFGLISNGRGFGSTLFFLIIIGAIVYFVFFRRKKEE